MSQRPTPGREDKEAAHLLFYAAVGNALAKLWPYDPRLVQTILRQVRVETQRTHRMLSPGAREALIVLMEQFEETAQGGP